MARVATISLTSTGAARLSMKAHRLPTIVLVLLFLLLPLSIASGKNQAVPVLKTVHKFRPDGTAKETARDIEVTEEEEARLYAATHPQTTEKSGDEPGKVAVLSAGDTKKRPATSTAPRAVAKLDDTAKKRPDSRPPAATSNVERKISAAAAYVMDARTGATLFAKSPDIPRQPASTIKVLTGLLAMEKLNNTDLVPVSKRAAHMPRSKVYLAEGKAYRANDLINSVLLASANDASVALAERIAGSEAAFARLMTQKARELGANKTVCKTANGLTAQGQQTTARDLAVIFSKAMRNPEFANRMAKVKADTTFGKTLRNHNKALWQISGAEGGKTGFTNAARQTYVGKFKRGNDEIVVSLLGSGTMWNDIAKLVEHGFAVKRSSTAANLPAAGFDTAPDHSPLVMAQGASLPRM